MDQVTKSDITEAHIRVRKANDAYESAVAAGYSGTAERKARNAAEAELFELQSRFAAQARA